MQTVITEYRRVIGGNDLVRVLFMDDTRTLALLSLPRIFSLTCLLHLHNLPLVFFLYLRELYILKIFLNRLKSGLLNKFMFSSKRAVYNYNAISFLLVSRRAVLNVFCLRKLWWHMFSQSQPFCAAFILYHWYFPWTIAEGCTYHFDCSFPGPFLVRTKTRCNHYWRAKYQKTEILVSIMFIILIGSCWLYTRSYTFSVDTRCLILAWT